jgi:hypothetical protein
MTIAHPAPHSTTDPSTRAGDPFAYAGDRDLRPHACLEGYVYLGVVVLDDQGEETEVIEAVRCRRCAEGD